MNELLESWPLLAVILFPTVVILVVVLSTINLDKKRWPNMNRQIKIVRVTLIGIGTITAVYLAMPLSSESDHDFIESSIASIERSLASLAESTTTQETLTANIETFGSLVQGRTGHRLPPEIWRLRELEMKWNKHCAQDRDVEWVARTREGWSILIDTVKIVKTSRDQESEFQEGKHVITKDSIVVKGMLVNSGNCLKIGGKIVVKDARGHLAGNLTYRETRD